MTYFEMTDRERLAATLERIKWLEACLYSDLEINRLPGLSWLCKLIAAVSEAYELGHDDSGRALWAAEA